jgi:putative FmdB family regulatory protein
MPIFEYACSKCGSEFETLVRPGSTPGCPSCQSTDLEKKLSVFASASSSAGAASTGHGPCGSCGHAGGPGSCGVH